MSIVLDTNKHGSVGEYVKDNTLNKANIDIASSIFTIYAYDELKKVLDDSNKLRFLFNEPTFIEKLESNQKEVKEFQLQMMQRERNVSEYSLEIGLKNNLDQNQVANRCHQFIQSKAEVKSVLKSGTITSSNIFVKNAHEKDFVISGNGINFSLDGLGYSNRTRWDFNTVLTEKNVIDDFESFYNSIWNNPSLVVDVKETLLEHITNLYKENAPELVYFVTLYHLFNEKLTNMDDMAKIKEKTGIHNTKIWQMLYNFQQDAAVGAIKKLELYNGCIIADSVGLGKTFEALAVMKYYELRNARVLVLAPKKLRGNWTGFKQNTTTNPLVDDRFNYDVLNHTDLSRENGFSGDINLSKINWGNYDLIVIDESHNFRNNPALKGKKTRYQKLMEDIIKSGIKTKVLMLSATPVNNRLADLKNQIMFITEDKDDAFSDNLNIESIENTLRIAQYRFGEWSKLPKEEQTTENLLPMLDYSFFNLLNTVTIARSRKHIQKYYDTKDIGEFPNRLKPISVKTNIDIKNQFPKLDEVNGLIAKLNLPVYSPLLYVMPSKMDEYEKLYEQIVKGGQGSFKQSDRERNLVNLMRVNILKRLESSIYAFKLTVERIKDKMDAMLSKIEHGLDYQVDLEEEIDDDEVDDLELGTKVKVKLKDLDLIRLKADLKEDQAALGYLLQVASKVTVKDDAKLIQLKNQIADKMKHPLNPGNKKVIIFTAFADTAGYLHDNLSEWLYTTFGIYTGIVTGSQVTKSNVPKARNDFEEILSMFSPKSNKATVKNQIDVLIATDCISEGQNLQDCDYLVNYDIHWNPVRIIQRFGRIDRIGSENKDIQLVNFWPNLDLDEYINLESRVRNRMTMVDISATGEDDLLNPESKNLKYRKDQLKQLQEEVVDLEDLSGGISITDLTLDDFIMSLDKYLKSHPGLLESYPTGIYAVTDINEKLINDVSSGIIFCLKQKNFTESEKGQNSLYPYHLVYVKEDGTIMIKNTNPKKILDIYKAITSNKNEPIKRLVNEFNQETKNGNKMDKYTGLLEKAIFDIKGYIEEKGIKSLFRLGKSTILDNKVTGLDDFELITFLVIK
ncbi:MAG: DEAD/DEAH box helicase family protein [Acholeplasmataceae bacterium]|nr:DEAD/DEAH box helicase family protein [Acholeplasmataceae bacterium]